MTRSDKTFESITFGGGPEGEERKRQATPIVDKRLTAELGNVSPVIIVPGRWTDQQIAQWGARVASWLVINAGFNCITPRVLVTHDSWPQRQPFLDAVGAALGEIALRSPYYPGAAERHASILNEHPDALTFGAAEEGQIAWTLVRGLDADAVGEVCFTGEAFCGLMAETPLRSADTGDFLEAATTFANDTLWGTLAANIVASEATQRELRVSRALDRAIHRLRYGGVCVNFFPGAGYGFGQLPIGAYPGADITDIQSGTGVVHNYFLLNDMEKVVIRGPFDVPHDPLLATTSRIDFGKRFAAFEAGPSLPRLLRLGWAASRS
jgi:hypothetical protein